MPNQQVAFDCRTEIIELHRFFTWWFSGELPNTDAAWSALENGLAPDFALITPHGTRVERDPLLTSLRPLHGQHGPAAGFKISIRNYDCRHVDDGLVLATYEEWQTLHGQETGRLSTALFERNPAMPNGVRWLHVHETWLPTSDA
jgi:hypothetical protein